MEAKGTEKQTGRPKLSESAKKRSKAAANRMYRAARKGISCTLELPISVMQRMEDNGHATGNVKRGLGKNDAR